MKRFIVVVLALVLITSFTLSSRAASARKLVQPWSKLKSLTDEQSEKIYQIHRKALADMKAIRERERKDIVALLSDAQKVELVESEEKSAVQRKKVAAADRMPTTAAATQSADAADEER